MSHFHRLGSCTSIRRTESAAQNTTRKYRTGSEMFFAPARLRLELDSADASATTASAPMSSR